MKPLPISFAILATGLSACGPSTTPPSNDGDAVQARAQEALKDDRQTGAELQEMALTSTLRTTYVCQNAERLTVDFDNPRQMATVRKSDGLAHDLVQEPTASGILYKSGRVELRGSGRQATWTPAVGDPTECRAID